MLVIPLQDSIYPGLNSSFDSLRQPHVYSPFDCLFQTARFARVDKRNMEARSCFCFPATAEIQATRCAGGR
jgi:hypothetical protein